MTNVRNVKSPHWRSWLDVDSRCVVPLTSFAELAAARRKASARLVRTRRKPAARLLRRHLDAAAEIRAEGEGRRDYQRPLRVLTTDANTEVGAIHPKAMPVMLTTLAEVEHWLTAPMEEALKLQRPLPDDSLVIVSRGLKEDPPNEAVQNERQPWLL